MGSTVTINSPNTVVHKKSGGKSPVFPDVCKTPSPGGPIPIPYPNITQSSSASKTASTIKANGEKIMLKKSVFADSAGDEAGSVGGVVSNCTKGKAQFITYAFDIKGEGQNIPRNTDMMKQNGGSAFNAVG